MNGYLLTFFTQQDRKHAGKPLADWLVQLAKDMGLRGATLMPGSEGYGHGRRLHSAHFFELADQPLEVVLAVSEDEAEQLLARLRSEEVKIFYVKAPIEFGTLGVDA